ncbi:MAG: AcrR family transcriptional regulator [Granulosicoccus sp.]|jgi:AcrR family transcriptional regulator
MKKTIINTKRSKGRPPSIDHTAALDAAVLTFWEHGYDGASLTDLTQAMKLSRPSLYAGFGDKSDLFIASLERYDKTIGCNSVKAFEKVACIKEAVRAFLHASIESNTGAGRPSGCLFASSASTMAESNLDVRKLLRKILKQSEQRLTQRFAAELKSGVLPKEPAPSARAALMIDLMSAQAIRARSGESRKELLAGLDARVAAVLASR